jgi:hypothetical protein
MPAGSDAANELLRGLAILADRDVRRAYVESIVRRAGLQLTPLAAWLLLRLEEGPGRDLQQLSAHERIPADRLEGAARELRDAGYVDAQRTLTAEGRAAHDKLSAARQARLMELYAEWPAWKRERLALTLQRLARELVTPRIA